MIFKELGMLSVVFFLVWSLVLSGTPSERIDRVCAPIDWTGRLLSSTTAAITPDYASNVGHVFERMDQGCKYVVWSTFYKDAYEKWEKENGQNSGSGQ